MGLGRTDLKTSSDPFPHGIPSLETKLAEWVNSYPFDAVLGAGQALWHAWSSVIIAWVSGNPFPQIFLYRVARNARAPRDLAHGQLISKRLFPDNRQKCHAYHSKSSQLLQVGTRLHMGQFSVAINKPESMVGHKAGYKPTSQNQKDGTRRMLTHHRAKFRMSSTKSAMIELWP